MPPSRGGDVARGPARPRERGGEQRLEPPRRLLAAHPQHRLDREAGADQSHRQERDREVVVDQASGGLGEQLVHLLAVADEAVGVLGGQADREPAEEQRRRPSRAMRRAGAARPVRRGGRAPARRPAGPGRGAISAGAVVAAREQRDTRRPAAAPCTTSMQRERPPALVGVRPHRLAPADRRQPGERPVADVAGRAQRVRRPEHGPDQPVGPRRALADLHRHRRHAGEQHTDAGERGAERDRPRRRLVEADHHQRDRGAHDQLSRDGHRERRRQRSRAAHDAGPHELAAPALLLAARVAADDEHAHQRRHDGAERAPLPRHVAADVRDRKGGPTIAIRPGFPSTVAT